jgi:peptidoglycan hydrolase-like protein with peptidoglycan-binding domain
MHGCAWRTGSAAIVISLCTLLAGAADGDRAAEFAQHVSEAGRGASKPSQPSVAETPAALSANSPEQIRKAQTELRRLECLEGRIDGKLGDRTRPAVKRFWTSAKQPVVEIDITDELISGLGERGDGFCRPARRFFAFGVRANRNSTLPHLVAPGIRPNPIPAAAARPPSDAGAR